MTRLMPSTAAACLLRSPLTINGRVSRSLGVRMAYRVRRRAISALATLSRPIALERRFDGREQLFFAERLRQEIHGAAFHRPHGRRDISVPA